MKTKLLFTLSAIVLSSAFALAQTADVSQYIMYFPFDGNLNEASSSGVTLSPRSTGTITYVDGQFGQAGSFNDSSYLTDGSAFNPGNSFSILSWVLINDTSLNQQIIHQLDDPATGAAAGRTLQLSGGADNKSFTSNIGEVLVKDPTTTEQGAWYHVAQVLDRTAGTTTLYVDGVLVAENATAAEAKFNNQELTIGGNKIVGNPNPMNGLLDDFLITNEVLDATTVNNIMMNGAANGGATGSIDDLTQNGVNLNLYKTDANTLRVKSNISFETYTVTNMLGQQVVNGAIDNNNINVNSISKGLYIVTLTSNTNGVSLSRKIVL